MSMTPSPLSADQERLWGMLAHLSAFVSAWFALGFVGPLIIMLTVGSRSAYVREHAKEATNFNLTVLIYIVVAGILVLLLVGLALLAVVGVVYLIVTIVAAVRAYNGEPYRYPLTIRFLK